MANPTPDPTTDKPAVLDYAPAEKPRETSLERATRMLTTVGGILVSFVGSVTLDGGQLWGLISLLFGPALTVCGSLVITQARRSGRKIRLVGPLALLSGLAMLLLALGLLA